LQVAVSLKLSNPELEEKVKANNPEILHKINMLLQSKRPSELTTIKGKEKLANQIKAQVEYVIGLRKSAPVIQIAPEGEQPVAPPDVPGKKGIAEVLFTSFIIQ
jgi:flagellar FliL protein